MKGLSMAELCYSERWVVTIQTVWPSKPKLLAIWPLTELVDSALSSITLFPKADRHLSFLITPELPRICHRCLEILPPLWGPAIWAQALHFQLPGAPHKQDSSGNTQALRYLKSHPTGQPASTFCTAVNYTSTYACGHNRNSMTQNPRTGVEIPPVKALPKTWE